MKLLSFLMKYSPRIVILALLAGTLSGISNTGLLALINLALKNSGPPSIRLIAGFAGLCLILPFTKFASEFLLTNLGQKALFKLRTQLSRQILSTPLRYLEEVGAHRLLATLAEDIPVLTNALIAIPILSINIAVVVAGLIYLGWLSLTMLVVVLLFVTLGVITYQVPIIRAVRLLRLAREESDALYNHFRTLTGGNKELKLHRRRREMFLSHVLEPTAASLCRQNIAGMKIYNAAASWGQVLVFIAIGLVVFALPSFKVISTQSLIGYSLTLLYMMAPLQAIMNNIPSISRASIAIKKIESLGLSLAARATEPSAADEQDAEPAWTSLELEGITHTYRREGDDTPFIMGPINLTFDPGELVFIIGGNGSGKTTLAKLLTGLYVPESGRILFNNLSITDENRDSYRQHFSVVFSDFHLFESLLGLDAPKLDERAQEYLDRLQLKHKVKIEDGVLSTTDLSQGQRKRLALLTAYLEDRPLYIFDEWAADQDPLFKRFFYLELLPELKAKGKTILVISHDDQYYDVADRLIKLDYGMISDDTHSSIPQYSPPEISVPR
jgi:putative pyoverdin transport system ATP-binding/permease protein